MLYGCYVGRRDGADAERVREGAHPRLLRRRLSFRRLVAKSLIAAAVMVTDTLMRDHGLKAPGLRNCVIRMRFSMLVLMVFNGFQWMSSCLKESFFIFPFARQGPGNAKCKLPMDLKVSG